LPPLTAAQAIVYDTAAPGLQNVLTRDDRDEKGSLHEKGVAFGETRVAEDEFGDGDGRFPTEEERNSLRSVLSSHLDARLKSEWG
jgi:hypothetical protein